MISYVVCGGMVSIWKQKPIFDAHLYQGVNTTVIFITKHVDSVVVFEYITRYLENKKTVIFLQRRKDSDANLHKVQFFNVNLALRETRLKASESKLSVFSQKLSLSFTKKDFLEAPDLLRFWENECLWIWGFSGYLRKGVKQRLLWHIKYVLSPTDTIRKLKTEELFNVFLNFSHITR